ncbi:MAG: metalloregulator ArsR/SmtB family transcription factor [Armatimonadetes bacterium]|nr:metalloregulator ArsR/SmtB family transcription factor [Armatimonadota bacterium]
MNPTEPDTEFFFEQMAFLGHALGTDRRLKIIDVLSQGERPVDALAHEISTSLANTSQHLRILRQARLVESRKEAQRVYYRLAEGVPDFWLRFRNLAAQRLAEMREMSRSFAEARDTLEPVDLRELLVRVSAGEVVLLDVRPESEYRAGHIPGALSIPLEELQARLAELPEGCEVAAYCRGPYCVMSKQAVELLCQHGFNARRMKEGVLEWQAQGLSLGVVPADSRR